jgi:para-aminobenzoate synthetase
MTGAPKKRSVELLHTLEDHNRSVYSGVFGFWDVGGGGDWSVVIRSCFKFDDACINKGYSASYSDNNTPEEWIIGAGGAITALSDEDAEFEEMCVKLQSVLKAFSAACSATTN